MRQQIEEISVNRIYLKTGVIDVNKSVICDDTEKTIFSFPFAMNGI